MQPLVRKIKLSLQKNKAMNTTAIREKLQEYIKVADEKKVRAIYTIIESDLNMIDEWWKDESFIVSRDRISNDLKSGVDKGFLWEEVKNELLMPLGKPA